MKFAYPLLLCGLAMPVMADCVTQSDLDAGVRATLRDGSYEDYRIFGANLIEMTGSYDDYFSRVLLGQGVYVVEVIDLENGKAIPETRTTYSYPVNKSDLPIPQPGGRWTAQVAARDTDGFFAESQSYVWGPLTSATYGDCSYDVIAGQVDYTGDAYRYSEEIHYLPALGISLLVSYTDYAEDQTDIYTYVAIEQLKN